MRNKKCMPFVTFAVLLTLLSLYKLQRSANARTAAGTTVRELTLQSHARTRFGWWRSIATKHIEWAAPINTSASTWVVIHGGSSQQHLDAWCCVKNMFILVVSSRFSRGFAEPANNCADRPG